jgi:hypothetical protein
MRKYIMAVLAALIATTGVAWAQQPYDSVAVPGPPNWWMPQYGPPPIDPSVKEPPPPPLPAIRPALLQTPSDPGSPPPPAPNGPPSVPNGPPAPPPLGLPSPFCDCPPAWRVCGWLSQDFMMVFTSPQVLPPGLVTDPAGNQLVGGSTSYGISYALRLEGGIWLDSDERFGVQAIITGIFRQNVTINVPAGNLINTTSGPAMTPLPFLLLGPGLMFTTWSQLNHGDVNNLFRIVRNDNFRLYGIIGAKYAELEEDVQFLYSIMTPGSIWLDEFHTRNDFYGVTLGLYWAANYGNWGVDMTLKCGLGVNYGAISVMGSNTNAAPSNFQVYTNDANIGFFETSLFSVMPEANVNLIYQFAPRIQLRVGYNFAAITNVMRPGPQIVPNLDPPNAGGLHDQPVLPFNTSTFIVHGVNFGVTWRY